MFIAVLFTIARIWKQPNCPSTDEWIKRIYIYIMEYYSVIKKNKILPFATKWMNLEGIRLSEVSQRKTNAVCYHLYVESKKQRKLVNIKKKKKEKIHAPLCSQQHYSQ